MAKILIFSDFHLHNWSYGATYENGWNSRLTDQKHIADQLVNLARVHAVDYVVFCGDLFHTHGKVEAGPLSVAADLFSRLKREVKGRSGAVTALIGNHDMGREASSVDWLLDMGVNVVKDVQYDTEMKAGFISYCDNEQEFDKRAAVLKQHELEYWFLHQGVRFLPVGSDFVIPNEFLRHDKLPLHAPFRLAFTGHYHSHQWATDKIVVIGAPMQFNWADKGDPRGCIVLDTWTHNWKFYPLKSPQFVTLDGALIVQGVSVPHHSPTHRQAMNLDCITDNFIKITEEVPRIFMDEVRKKLKEAGARSVEFSFKQAPAKVGMATNVFDLESLIDRYIKINKVSTEGVKIASQIRSGEYEAA